MKFWQCSVCKYIHEGEQPPEKCPVCGVDKSKFVEIDEASIPENKRKKRPAEALPKPHKPPVEEQAPPQPPAPAPTLRGKIESLLVKHHAHPVSVHTPNGVLPMAVVLYVLAWLFNAKILATAAMISQIFVLISLPFVVYTGTLEWRTKYNAAMSSVFKLKIVAAALTCATCVISFFWYVSDPGLLTSPRAWVFILVNILMLACAGIAGHIGGKLVFKD